MKRKSIYNLFSLDGAVLIVATFLHNVTECFPGYWSGFLLIFHKRNCRAIVREAGKQIAELANGIGLTIGKISTIGLYPAIFGPAMNVNVLLH